MKYEFPVHKDHIRTLHDPRRLAQEEEPDAIDEPVTSRTMQVFVRFADLPDFPLNPDPRVPKLHTQVAKRIASSAASNDGKFHLLNRGITLSVKSAEYDSKRGILRLEVPDEPAYGIVDGGHTHHVIRHVVNEAKSKFTDDLLPLARQYARLEILIGVEPQITDIAEARNFSRALKAYALENHRGRFEWLLGALGEHCKYVRVRENEDEPIPVTDLIQIMCSVNPVIFPPDKASVKAPVDAYTNAGKCLSWFIDDNNSFKKMELVTFDIIRLYDYIRAKWHEKYNEEDEQGKRGRLGARSEMNKRKRNRQQMTTYYFLEDLPCQKSEFPVEKGHAIPLMSVFRLLLAENAEGNFVWSQNPFLFYDRFGTDLVRYVMDKSRQKEGDAHNVGRDSDVYKFLAMIAENKLFQMQILKQQELAAQGELFPEYFPLEE